MPATASLLAIGLTAASVAALLGGCHNPPPPQISVPSSSGGNPYSTYHHDEVKPLPPSATRWSAQPPADPADDLRPTVGLSEVVPQPAAVSQTYLDAYDRVGRPRLVVIIDRPEHPDRGMVPEDYELIERVVRDAVAGGGQVAVVPPGAVHERLTAQQLRDLYAGKAAALKEIGSALRADVMIEVKVNESNDQIQLTANARNTRDGQQIATTSSSIPAGAARRQIDFGARLLGERMVDALADTWDRFARDLSKAPPPPSASATAVKPPPPGGVPAPVVPAPPPPAVSVPATQPTSRP